MDAILRRDYLVMAGVGKYSQGLMSHQTGPRNRFPKTMPPLADTILTVDGGSSQKEMTGVNARRVITRVAHKNARRNRPFMYDVRKSVSANYPNVESSRYYAVSITILSCRAFQTPLRSSGCAKYQMAFWRAIRIHPRCGGEFIPTIPAVLCLENHHPSPAGCASTRMPRAYRQIDPAGIRILAFPYRASIVRGVDP